MTDEEIAVLERHAQQARGLHVAEIVAYSDSTIRQRTRQIPVDYGGKFWPDYRPGDTYGAYYPDDYYRQGGIP